MSKRRWWVAAAVLSVAVVGCGGDPSAQAEPIGPERAHALSENLLGAINDGNYEEFRRDMSPELIEIYDQQAFTELRSRLHGVCGAWQSVEPPWQTSNTPAELRFETDASYETEDVHVWLWFEAGDPRLRGFWMDSPGLQSAP